MTQQRISLSIAQWMSLREDCGAAPPIWFTVVGGSMFPLIRRNRDRVMLIQRGNLTIDCDDPKWRKKAERWVRLWRIRPLLMLPHRAVDKLERLIKKGL